ncbi:MAG: FMN-binding negative transcriptional regulator [Cyanobacteria bacterium J06642_2]
MYLPKPFEEADSEALHALIRAAPLATLVIHTQDGLVANHIPFVLHLAESEPVKLQAHIPRSNPLSSILEVARDCLAIFHGPEGYISPSFYATKKVHGKVVPTWNYSVVHVHGKLRAVDDVDWILNQVEALTNQHERPRVKPWEVSDAPAEFTQRLTRVLIGLELDVERMVGKTKASQNQPKENQASILRALDEEAPEAELSDLMHSVLGNASARATESTDCQS